MNSKSCEPPAKATFPDLLDLAFLVWLIVALQHFSYLLFSWSGKAEGLLVELAFLCGAIIYLRARRFSLRLIQPNRFPLRALPSTIALSIAGSVLLDELERIVITFIPLTKRASEALAKGLSFSDPLEMVFIFGGVVVAASIVEEMIFRGVIQKTLAQRSNPTAAILITSLIFAVIHFQPSWFIQLLIFSVTAGYMAWRANSLIPSMIFHACVNMLSAILILNLFPSIIPIYLWRGHVNPFITIAAGLVFIQGFRLFNLKLKSSSAIEKSV